jgi:hypothetical protein
MIFTVRDDKAVGFRHFHDPGVSAAAANCRRSLI